jgi:uncharacterized protein
VRLVLDTNTALSGLLWPEGPPSRLIDAAEAQRVELASSTALLAELQGVLTRPKFAAQLAKRGLSVADVFDGYAALVTCITPTATPGVSRDPDDDHVLACALAARADLIVSGDNDLLVLERFEGIAIVNAAQALGIIEAGGT